MSNEKKDVLSKTLDALRVATFILVAFTLVILVACGGGGGGSTPAPPSVTVTVTPSTASVILGNTHQFTAAVTGSSNQTVTWSVNGVTGGSASVGMIDSTGLYTAPADLPSSANVTISATSQVNSADSGNSQVAVTSDIAVTVNTAPGFKSSVSTNSSVSLSAAITSQGKPDQNINWSVNGIAGGNSSVGVVSSTGAGTATYQAPATVPTPFTVTIAATSVADSTKAASLPMIVAGTIASVSQTISAANGGTITLPDGSSVTIPPGLLAADQTLTLTEYSVPPDTPANGVIAGIGPALYVYFPGQLQLQPAIAKQKGGTTRLTTASSSSALAGMVFNINFGVNLPSIGSVGTALASFATGAGNFIYQGVAGTFDAASKVGRAALSAGCVAEIQSVVNSPATLAIGAYFVTMSNAPPDAPTRGLLSWNPSTNKFKQLSKEIPCPSPISNNPALIVVHGMLSSVEGSYSAMLTNKQSFLRPTGYGDVFGIDYDWWNGIDQNGQYVASEINQVIACESGNAVDIMAHSEGVPVVLSAMTQTSVNVNPIRNIMAIAGPILGTPVAKTFNEDLGPGKYALLTIIGNFPYQNMVYPPISIGGLPGLLSAQFALDLENDPSVCNSLPNLQTVWQKSPLSEKPLILVGGTNADTAAQCLIGFCFGLFQHEPFDDIVGLDSSFAAGMNSTLYRIPAVGLEHTGMVGNPDVLLKLQGQLSKLNSSSAPSLTISTGSTSPSCNPSFACSALPGAVYNFVGTGFLPGSKPNLYIQDPTGTEGAPIQKLTDQTGSVKWTDPTPCSKAPGVYGMWLYDEVNHWASNSVIEEVLPGSCLPTYPAPSISSLYPSSLGAGANSQTMTISGTGFFSTSSVTFNGIAHASTLISSGRLAILLTTADLAASGSFPVIVTNPTPGGGPSNSVSFVVTGSGPNVAVSPSSAQVTTSGTQQFVATVTGIANTAVTWSVNGTAGGNSVAGTVDATGLYTAPATVPTPPSVTVTATSQASPNVSGSANVTIGPYSETPSYSFTSLDDGAAPSSPLIQANDGYFYGTAQLGGTGCSAFSWPSGCGTVFKADSSGNITSLHEFAGYDGAGPLGALVLASDGNFYGTTQLGGVYNEGTIFRMDSNGQVTTFYSFARAADGAQPLAGLIQASDGNLYGMAWYGGIYDYGTVYKIDLAGNLTTLRSFSGPDGRAPWSALIQAQDGYLYGTTSGGGDYSYGTIFKMDLAGNLNTLYSFTGGTDGGYPGEALLQANDGQFYGTTAYTGDLSCTVSGTFGCGTIFRMDSVGNLTTLHDFSGGVDGGVPFSSLIQAGDGDFYGTTVAGGDPICLVTASGELYSTYIGCGTVFKMDSAGNLSALYSFTGSTSDGSNPIASLVQGSDGFFYGTTRWGGTDSSCPYTDNGGCGTIFKVAGPGGPVPPQLVVPVPRSATPLTESNPLLMPLRPIPRTQTGSVPLPEVGSPGAKPPLIPR